MCNLRAPQGVSQSERGSEGSNMSEAYQAGHLCLYGKDHKNGSYREGIMNITSIMKYIFEVVAIGIPVMIYGYLMYRWGYRAAIKDFVDQDKFYNEP